MHMVGDLFCSVVFGFSQFTFERVRIYTKKNKAIAPLPVKQTWAPIQYKDVILPV